MSKCTCNKGAGECGRCESAIADHEINKILERVEPKPLKNDSLKERGNPNSRFYDGI